MTIGDLSTVPDRSTVFAVLRAASRAPSVHNTQPWRWVSDGPTLRLYRDDRRRLEVADPSGRQLVISCGAMLHHVRTAFGAAGWHTDVVRLPDPEQPDWLATVDFRPWPDPPPGVLARAEAMSRRYTARLPMAEPRDWADLEHRLRLLVSPHEVELDVLAESARPRVVTASEHTAAVQRYDMQYQAELHWWTGHFRPTEGVPPEALTSPAEAGRAPIGRAFPTVDHPPRDRGVEDHARVVALGTDDDTPEQWLRAGEALSAVLLECTAAGQASCALTHLTELPAARRVMSGLSRHPGVPQVVIRIGADDGHRNHPPTPRRAVSEFLTVAPSG